MRVAGRMGWMILIAGSGIHGAGAQTMPVAPPATAPAGDYQLVWADEFNKDGPLDPKDWSFEQGFVRNQELQWYQPDNALCKGGFLVIEARREKKPNPRYVPTPTTTDAAGTVTGGGRRGGGGWQNREFIEYTSASVNTRGKHAWLFGRFEIRAKIDTRLGSWPAFWSLGTQGGWPANGEIDIMEYYRGTLLANIAWAGDAQGNGQSWNTGRQQIATFPKDWSQQFHTWHMDWDENAIKLYVDDVLANSQDLGKTINIPGRLGGGGRGRGAMALSNPFHGPAYILLNQAIGGTQGGDPSGTDFPIRFEVDYVRVWQTASQIGATAAATQPSSASQPATQADR
jgi:beta-glucanase (GH16 family)